MRRTWMILIAAALAMTLGIRSPVGADPSTGRLRSLDCGEAGVIAVELGPAELLTTTSASIHLVNSTAVLVPARVVVITPVGEIFVTLDKKLPSQPVVCRYRDPAGLAVTITGSFKPRS